jgi:MFS family permease
MQTVAMAWYVYVLTGSNALLGFISLMSLGPTLLVSPFAGVLVDRLDKRAVIVATQVLAMVQAFALSALILTEVAQVWHIIALSLFMGVVGAVDIPSRQAFMVEIVDERASLPNAIALNSSMFNLARIAGPTIAAITMRLVGAGMCFLINGISYVAVIIALMAMRIPKREAQPEERHVRRELKEGAAHAFGSVPIRSILAFLSVMSFCSGAYVVLLPAYASKVFLGNETTYGAFYAAVGLGALTAAVRLASRQSVLGLGRVIFATSMAFSICLVLIGVAPIFWIALPLFAGVGFGMMTHMASCNTLVQTVVEDRYRGRVMSFYAMSFMVPMPIGSLIAGSAADFISPRWVMVQFGLVGVLGALLFMRALPAIRRELRPIYIEKGILARPEVEPLGK